MLYIEYIKEIFFLRKPWTGTNKRRCMMIWRHGLERDFFFFSVIRIILEISNALVPCLLVSPHFPDFQSRWVLFFLPPLLPSHVLKCGSLRARNLFSTGQLPLELKSDWAHWTPQLWRAKSRTGKYDNFGVGHTQAHTVQHESCTCVHLVVPGGSCLSCPV